MVKLIATNQITKSFNKLVSLGESLSLSIIYYTAVQGNVQPIKSLPRKFASDLPAKYRQFVCAKWNKEKNVWVYNRSKSELLLETLDITFKETSFEDFVTAIETRLAAIEAEKQVELSADEQIAKVELSLGKQVSKLVELGLSSAAIEVKIKDMILQAQKKAKDITAK